MNTWTVTNVKPYCRGTCLAFFDVTLPPGITLRGFSLHERDGKRWAAFPSTPKLDAGGVAERDEQSGKVKYFPIVFIEERALWERFSSWAAEEAFKLLPKKPPQQQARPVVDDLGIPF